MFQFYWLIVWRPTRANTLQIGENVLKKYINKTDDKSHKVTHWACAAMHLNTREISREHTHPGRLF